MKYKHNAKIKTIAETRGIINEGDTSRSTQAEKVLESLINMQALSNSTLNRRLSTGKNDVDKFLIDYHNMYIKTGTPFEVYSNAISQIKKMQIDPSALNVGSRSFPTSKIWKQYGGISSSTSKSDIITNTETYSVKNASTQVRVLDASLPQLTALVYYTIDTLGIDDTIQRSIKTNLNKLKKLQSNTGFSIKRITNADNSKLGLAQMRKLADGKIKKIISDFDTNSKEINSIITNIFKTVSGTSKFKSKFISESISGRVMFGPSSKAYAESILTWTADFKTIKLHSISTITKSILNTFDVPKILTKTSGFRITKTFQAYYKSVNESMSRLDALVEKESHLLHKSNMGLITEGVFTDIWNDLKNEGKVIIDKIIETLGKWIDMAIELTSRGWREVLDFFGITIDIQIENMYAPITYGEI